MNENEVVVRPKLTYVCFILDETGSMQVCKKETISGFNEYIQTLKNAVGVQYLLGLTKFNSTKVEIVYSPKPLPAVEELTEETYQPDHLTPLLDAVGKTINGMEQVLESEQEDYQVLCVIMTDGEENASKEFTRNAILSLINEKKATGKWEFVFLGANQDAWAAASSMGISRQYSAPIDTGDMRGAYSKAAFASVSYAQSSKVDFGKYTAEDDKDD